MGADTTIIGENNLPFYLAAAVDCKNDIVMEALSIPNIDLSLIDNDGNCLLHYLPDMNISIENYFKNENFIEMFRKCSKSVELYGGYSVLQTAANTSNLPFLKYLFEYGEPELELKTPSGETPIFENLRYHFHKDILEYLIEKGADVNAQNDQGNSLIFESVFPEGTEILLKAGASTQILNNKGQSALHYAAERNDFNICLLLLRYGADLNLEDENNKKPSDLCTYKYLKDFLLFISD